MKIYDKFIWTIESWQKTSKLPRGESVESDTFSLVKSTKIRNSNELHWKLYYYPEGRNLLTDRQVMGLTYKCYRPTEVTVKISLLDHQNKKVFSKKSPTHSVDYYKSVIFYNFFNLKPANENVTALLNEDKIVLLCEVWIDDIKYFITKSTLDSKKLESCESLQLSENEDSFEIFMEEKKFSDIIFKLGEKEIHSHKIILTRKSHVFDKMFEHDTQENQQSFVKVEDIEYHIFKEMLRFIYTGKVNNIDHIAEELIYAAYKYEIHELKKKCEAALSKNITLDNVCKRMEVAICYDTIVLRKELIEFIISNKQAVVSKPRFKVLMKSCTEFMFELLDVMSKY